MCPTWRCGAVSYATALPRCPGQTPFPSPPRAARRQAMEAVVEVRRRGARKHILSESASRHWKMGITSASAAGVPGERVGRRKSRGH